MILKPVECLPARKKVRYKRLGDFFKSFIDIGSKYAKLILEAGDYTTNEIAYRAITNHLRQGYPEYANRIWVTLVNGEVYLVRTDMEGRNAR